MCELILALTTMCHPAIIRTSMDIYNIHTDKIVVKKIPNSNVEAVKDYLDGSPEISNMVILKGLENSTIAFLRNTNMSTQR